VKIQVLIVADWNQKLRLTGRLRHSTCSASGQWQLHAWAAASPLRSATYIINSRDQLILNDLSDFKYVKHCRT